MHTKQSFGMKMTYWTKVVSLGLILGLGLQFAQAWTAPTVAPPGGNVAGPVTLGNTGQWKTGNLAINTGWDTNNDGTADTWGANGLLVPNGNVAIGTTNPWARLSVKENANSPYQGVSIMDPTDHVGLYLWSDGNRARVSGCNDGNCNLLINGDGTGNVGIAISGNPTAALDVNGRIRMRQQTVASDNADIVATKGYVDGKAVGGDNLGNHTATQALNMANFDINAAKNVNATAFYYTSDRRFKEGIETLDGSLDKLLRLDGVSFRWKQDGRQDIGVIAQDVEEVFPELVKTDPMTGFKSVQYGNLVAPLIEAIKEQQKEIETLKAEVEALKK